MWPAPSKDTIARVEMEWACNFCSKIANENKKS